MYVEPALLRVFEMLHGVDAYVDGLFCDGIAMGSQCLQLLLKVPNTTLRAHAKELCRARARQLLTAAPMWSQPLLALAREVVTTISAQVPPHELDTEQVAVLADLHARTGLEAVRDVLQAAVYAAPTADNARAKQMLAAGACHVSLTPYLALCQHVATGAQDPHGYVWLRQDIARALRLRQRQAEAAGVVPQAVLAVLAACARINWHETHTAGVFRLLLDFVRVHASDIPVGSVQGRIFLREAAHAWRTRGPAAGHPDVDVACAEFLEMYTHVLEVQCARLHASDACVDVEASLLLHAVQHIAATPPCMAMRVFLPDLWCVVRGVQQLRVSAHTAHTPAVLALLDAHARVLSTAPASGLPPLPAASLLACTRVRMGPRAVVRALEHVVALHATRRDVSDQYALIALAGHFVREAALSTFVARKFPQRLEPLATSAAALLLRSTAGGAPGAMPPRSEHWDAVAFINSCLNKLVHSGVGVLAPAWQRCLHDVAEALEAFAVHADPGGFAPLLHPAYAFTRQTVMLLHSKRLHGAHVPPVLLAHVLAYAVSQPAPMLLSAAATLHALQLRRHPVVSHELLMPFFAQLGAAACTEDTRHLLVIIAARLCRAQVHASVCVADLLATLLPRMQPRLGTLASIYKALFAAVLVEAPLCRHTEHLYVLLTHATAVESEVSEREAYYRLRIVLLGLAQAPCPLGAELAPAVLGLLQHVQTHALGETRSRRVHTSWLAVLTMLLRQGVPLGLMPECKQLVLAASALEHANVHSRIALQALVAQAVVCELRAAVRAPCPVVVCARGSRRA